MIKKINLISIILLITVSFSCARHYMLPQPFGTISRNDIISKYLKNRELDLIEGLWVWDDNKYEVCIVKNPSPNNKQYDYVAIITSANDPYWSLGETKILIKKTASKRLFSATYYMGDKSNIGTTVIITNDNMISLNLPTGPYGIYQTTHLIRSYPQDEKQSTSSELVSTGTGFFISEDIIATNSHIVAEKKDIKILINETEIPATVLVKDNVNDLALLKIQLRTKEYTLTEPNSVNVGDVRDMKEGDAVFSIGYPLVTELGKRAKISEGIINSISGVQDDPRMFQISVPIQPGNSGSPLFNNRGEVIGIITSTINNAYLVSQKKTFPQNVNFAVKINYLNNLLSLLPDKINLRTTSTGKQINASQLMTIYKDSVVLIKAKK